jgi:Transposase DDE domain group 1
MTECNTQLTFSFLKNRRLTVDFSGGEITSDAGLLLLRQFDENVGFSRRLTAALPERRQSGKVQHASATLLGQRLYSLVAGYEDLRDAKETRYDPLLQAVAAGDVGPPLASQPTLTRWENRASRNDLRRIGDVLLDAYLAARPRGPRRLILDLDSTEDVCHGHQQLAFFSGFFKEYIYHPLVVVDGDWGYPLATLLRSGNAHDRTGCPETLTRILTRLRRAWKHTRYLVRGDAGFAAPDLYAFCQQHHLHYLFGWNAPYTLRQRLQPQLAQLLERFQQCGRPQKQYLSFPYQAGTWPRPLRVCAKLVANAEGTNLRFIITNLTGSARHLFNLYEQRGAMENRIKELKRGLFMDRLSCHRFRANAFRLAISTAAYALLVLFRRQILSGTQLEAAQVETLRANLFKIGARVRRTARRLWVHLASGWPRRELLVALTQRLTAAAPT